MNKNITNLLPCTINVHSFLNVKKKYMEVSTWHSRTRKVANECTMGTFSREDE